MQPPSTAVNDVIQIAWGVLGLLVLGIYFVHPKSRVWRRSAPTAPAWTTSLPDTLLLFAVTAGAVFVSSLLAFSVVRFVPGGQETGSAVQILAGNIGMFASVPLVLLATVVYLRSHGTPVAPLNAPEAPAPLDAIGLGFLTYVGAAPLILAGSVPWTLLLQRLGIATEKQPVVELLLGDSSPAVRLGLALVAIVIAPVTEELVFRAGVFRFFRGLMPRWAAIAASALIFATLHFNLAGFIPLAVLGAVWAHMYERSGSIVVTIVAHMLFNLTSVALMLGGQVASR